MWFAALGSYRENIWFLNTLLRLLQGSPEVLGLMGENPFPKQPPKFVRAQLYEYRFGDRDWWTRKSFGLYVPAVSLADLNSLPLARENTIK